MTTRRELVRDALSMLGTRRLILSIHDASFPARDSEDIGRSSPYGSAARDFVGWVSGQGFDALQLGPQGKTAPDNASPYDGTYLSRNPLSIDLSAVARAPETRELFPHARLDAAIEEQPDHAPERGAYGHAARATGAILDALYERFRRARDEGDSAARALDARLSEFRNRNAAWLERDALYDAISRSHGGVSHRHFPAAERHLWARTTSDIDRRARVAELSRHHAPAIERYALAQLLWHDHHARFRREVGALGLATFGDLQVGGSPGDAWSLTSIALPGYLMGAPPSRTNPEGQPWGYAVLDPAGSLDATGDAQRFLRLRVGKLLREHDGIRVDHPHGLVCPWVYRDDDDPLHAVQHGARLFASPDLPDHPALAEHAIARADQLDRSLARHADGWVRELDDAQVARYARLVDACLETFRAHGRDPRDFACEVLSTMPFPLGRVLDRHGLGRFRVTQKADLDDPSDVYRSENAKPADWVMVATHDTPPIFRVVAAWTDTERRRRSAYLASRLRDPKLAETAADDAGTLVHALVADLFASPAEQVVIFFADLFGLTEVYNAPGTTSQSNWTLRLGPDFEAQHRERSKGGRAIDLRRALAMALRARGDLGEGGAALAAALDRSRTS